MKTIEPTTVAGWKAALNDLNRARLAARGIADDAIKSIRRNALARHRGEPTAVSVSKEAEDARDTALAEIESLERRSRRPNGSVTNVRHERKRRASATGPPPMRRSPRT
jgi:hypothetical protein